MVNLRCSHGGDRGSVVNSQLVHSPQKSIAYKIGRSGPAAHKVMMPSAKHRLKGNKGQEQWIYILWNGGASSKTSGMS